MNFEVIISDKNGKTETYGFEQWGQAFLCYIQHNGKADFVDISPLTDEAKQIMDEVGW